MYNACVKNSETVSLTAQISILVNLLNFDRKSCESRWKNPVALGANYQRVRHSQICIFRVAQRYSILKELG